MPRIDDIRFRRGTAAQWASTNPVLNPGEPGLETDTAKTKYGDGSTAWNALPYSVGASSGGGTTSGAIAVAYSAAIPLDTTGDGKTMPQTTLTTSQVFAVAPGAIEGGICQLCLVGDGAHSPDLSAFTNGNTYTYSSVAGDRNLLVFAYQYGSAIFVGVQLSATDQGAPTLLSATVSDSDATTINLLWSEPMNSLISAAAAFTIAGHAITAHTRVDSTNTKLTTSAPIVQSETLSVVYAIPGSNPMQDLASNQVLAFSHSLINNVTNPQIASAIVSNSTPTHIDLTWSDTISSTVPAASAFAVSAGHTLTAHTYVDSTHTQLVTSAAFVGGETARTLSYTVPGSNPIKDLAVLPNLGLSITGKTITNNVVSASGNISVATPTVANDDLTASAYLDWYSIAAAANASTDNHHTSSAITGPTLTNMVRNAGPASSSTMSWTANGTPNASGSNAEVGLFTANAAGAFVDFTVPADTTVRKARFLVETYVDGASSADQLVSFHLSDSSFADQSAVPTQNTGGFGRRYTLYEVTYNAASSGQTLRLRFANNPGAANWEQGVQLVTMTI